MDEQHAARLNTEGVELGDQLGLRNGLLWHEGIISQTPPEIAVGAKRPPLPQPPERRGTLRLPVEEVAFEVRQEMTWQVRRLISAPVVEPESVAETVASSHSPLALHRGFRTHRLSLASAQRSAPSRRLISICQRSPEGQPGDSHVLAIG